MDNSEPRSQSQQPAELTARKDQNAARSVAAVDNIPDSLLATPQWVCWRYIARDGKTTKAPVNPHDGGFADSTSRATWGTFEQALEASRNDRSLAGIGFVFTADDPYCGVDLDDSVDESTGQLKPWAQQIVDRLDSYTEISPSGSGLKVFIKANKPGSRCRKSYEDGEVEIYDRDRFFTVTGNRVPSIPSEVNVRQESLDAVYSQVFVNDESAPVSRSNNSLPIPGNDVAIALSDDAIVELACNKARTGDKFQTLWNGHWNDHFNSASEADASVIFSLAYYTKDAVQLDRIFRQSKLMRTKWDEVHGSETYGNRTISLALQKVKGQYRGKANRAKRGSTPGPCTSQGSTTITPGNIDPTTKRLILATERTLPTGEAFIRQFYWHPEGRTLLHYGGLLLGWNRGRYNEIEDASLKHQLFPWMHAAVQMVYKPSIEKYVPVDFPANPRTVNAALDSVKSCIHLPIGREMPCWLHGEDRGWAPRDIVSCKSTLLHLPTWERIPATPRYFTMSALDFDPTKDSPPPTQWFRFLHQLFDGDIQSWDLIQDWFGYCLTSDTSLQKMLLIVGPRRCGKGTIARVLTRLIGPSNICGPTTTSLAGPFGLQHLVGKSLAIVSDARFSGDSVQTVIERLLCISGEDSLTIDRKHLPSLTMKLPTRFMLLTNELPRLHDSSGALAGRFMTIRLTESFYGKEDPSLTEKLLLELPSIFNWAVEGWRRLRERGMFVQPSCGSEDADDMLALSSPVTLFVRDCCEIEPTARVGISTLYEAWCQWCRDEGMSYVPTRQTFGRDLVAAFPSIHCRRNQATGRFYDGIKLKLMPGSEASSDA